MYGFGYHGGHTKVKVTIRSAEEAVMAVNRTTMLSSVCNKDSCHGICSSTSCTYSRI